MKKKIGLKNFAKKRLTNCSKKQQPFAKKKKPNEDFELNAPIVTSVEELVGKKVQHLTFDYDGEEKFFPGVVVCQKPNSDTELVIRYDWKIDYILLTFLIFKILS